MISEAKQFIFDKDCKKKIFDGIKLMYNTVTQTLGPHGRNSMIDMMGQVILTTKDGVTVAQEVRSSDPWIDMGCRLVREASQNCNEDAGDGTTSVIVLIHEMAKEAMNLRDDVNVIKVKRGMQKAVDTCTEAIKAMSKPITEKEDFKKVAFISSQDEEIATKVSDVFMQSGDHGTIDIERSDDVGMEIEHTDGYVIENGSIVSMSNEVLLEDCPVLVTDKDIKFGHQIIPVMEELAKNGIRKLFVVCDNLSGEAHGIVVQNINQGKFMVIAAKAPSFGKNRIEIMKDICSVTGSTFVSDEENVRLDKITMTNLGRARRITINKKRSVIVSMDTLEIRKRIKDRITEIETIMKDDTKDGFQKEWLLARLASLTDGISIIRFGAVTEVERHEKKHRITDAVCAVRSAKEEGVTVGGGTAYLRCMKALDDLVLTDRDEKTGAEIVRNALKSISLRVLEVAGIPDKELIVSKIIEKGKDYGYDFEKGDIADLWKSGVIEPCKVIRCCIQNAASCAMTFLSVQVGISPERKDAIDHLAESLKEKLR